MRLSLLLAILAFPCATIAADRPNVLFIIADDLRAELGCLGDRHIISPNLDRLAARGRLFTRAYCQQAVCNPSRASFMTGLRPDTIGVWDLKTHFRKKFPQHPTLPQFFKDHGYETICIGKSFHNTGSLGDPQSWSQPARFNEGPHWADTVANKITPNPERKNAPVTERIAQTDEAYWDGEIATHAVRALGKNRTKPFFLTVGFWRPHLPFVAPAKYWNLYNLRDITLPASWTAPEKCPPIALHNFREIRGYAKMPKEFPLTVEFTRHLRHGYVAGISYLDAQVGRVLAALDRNGLRENTIIVFISDHGFHLGEHGLWCKTSCFEYDARVPVIISTPGMKQAGRASASITELIDLYPTLADLARLRAPKILEGKSLIPILDDPTASIKPAAFTQHPRPAYYRGRPDVMGVSVATSEFRYTEWRDFKTGRPTATEFYDHTGDLAETRNTAADAGNRSKITTAKSLLSTAFKRLPNR
jgi:iduronate 2-sulfatase